MLPPSASPVSEEHDATLHCYLPFVPTLRVAYLSNDTHFAEVLCFFSVCSVGDVSERRYRNFTLLFALMNPYMAVTEIVKDY
jgi:hypothetical protein